MTEIRSGMVRCVDATGRPGLREGSFYQLVEVGGKRGELIVVMVDGKGEGFMTERFGVPSMAQLRAVELLHGGYYQTSNKFRSVACLPRGADPVELLGSVSGRPEWAELLGPASCTDQYLRRYGTAACPAWATLDPPGANPRKFAVVPDDVFREFRKMGGGPVAGFLRGDKWVMETTP